MMRRLSKAGQRRPISALSLTVAECCRRLLLCELLAVVPGEPGGRSRVTLHWGQVIQRIGAGKEAGLDQRQVRVAHVGPTLRLVGPPTLHARLPRGHDKASTLMYQ